MVIEDSEEQKTITKHDFYFETPLYEWISLDDSVENLFHGDVDAYSAKNSTDTTYSISLKEVDTWWNDGTVGYYLVTLTCKRKSNDILRFFIFKDNKLAAKFGQYPSMADLQFSEIGKKFDKVLPEEDLKNLKKAIGLVSHGAGAGSFVYLRKIFENLIFETFTNHSAELKISAIDFKAKRMMEKVEILENFLPTQLLEMKGIYSILSKGVHELTEEECLKYFAPIKLSIELILDQKIESLQKKEKDEKVKKQLKEIQKEIK